MMTSLDRIEKVWLSPDRKTRFMFDDRPSICDLSLACEITQLDGIGMGPMI